MNSLVKINIQTQILKMMKKIGIILSIVLIAFACTSTLAQETQIRKVSGFIGIEVSEGIKVTLTMGDEEKVEVFADKEYIDKVITEVNGNDLEIYIKGNNNWNKGRKIEVKVTAKDINKIHASSGSSLTTTNKIKTNELKISVSSGAGANVECEVDYVFTDASSGANAKIKGNTNHFGGTASSGSSISANDLKAQKAKADVSSGASIKIHAVKEIKAEASSGGSVKYSGSPEIKDIHKSSGGSVRGV